MEMQQMALIASKQIKVKDKVYLDAGLTCFELAKIIIDKDIVIFTNSVLIQNLHAKNVVVLKGKLNQAINAYASRETIDELSTLKFDKSFFGFSSFDKNNFYTSSAFEAKIKQAAIANSKVSFVIGNINKKFDGQEFAYASQDKVKPLTI